MAKVKELNYNKALNFLHCKSCIEQFLGSDLHKVMTPKEYGLYEASSYEYEHPSGEKEIIIVIWCKRCGRSVWDSRSVDKDA